MSRSTPPSSIIAPSDDDRPLLESKHRLLLLAGVMMVSICQFLDATIANVALPHMQAALGASSDSVSWVLTSFIMAGAIFMPITGWLSDRIGSRNLFIGSTALFLLASAACGASTSLTQMVVFRAIQGMSAAFLGPMTQTIMFDISPPSKQASTMSNFGMLVMVAPISGPFLGGFLTDYLNWRWIYYVNLPMGIPALLLLWWLLPSRPIEPRRLDYFGFATLGLALGALQLMLDRGQPKDWFASREIVIEGMLAISLMWFYFVHTRTTRSPLFNRALFKNPHFLVSLAFMTVLGLTNVALSSVLPTMYQTIYNYPVIQSGLLMAPRGIGVIITSTLTTWLLQRVDFRYIIVVGYVIASLSIFLMTTWSIDMDWHRIAYASFIQGLGLGMVFAPMNLVAFATISPELRPDGASLLALFRNIGGSCGISMIVTLLARNQQVAHADLAASLHMPTMNLPAAVTGFPAMAPAVAQMVNGEVTRQAMMIAYLDNFYLLAWLVLAMAPLPLVLKKPARMTSPSTEHLALE
jgi:DHA2 family multidrug resistance protein